MNELALFAGAGGGILGGKLLGWRTICAVEWDEHAREVLAARQNDGCLEPFPIWDDVQTFDGKPWRGIVDVVSGGFPCQDISAAGKGAGIDGERSSMWSHMARIIGEVRPRFVFVENSPLLVGRGLARVLGNLASMGYDARWGIVGAHHVAAPHKRDRIWLMGYSHEIYFGEKPQNATDGKIGRLPDDARPTIGHRRLRGWLPEPRVGRVADGVADAVDRYARLGNGQVPQVAALAWEILGENAPICDHCQNGLVSNVRQKQGD